MPAYCILNTCRIIYSLQTRDVVISKRAAAWALDHRLARHHDLIRTALRAYARNVSPEDEQRLQRGVHTLVEEALKGLEKTVG